MPDGVSWQSLTFDNGGREKNMKTVLARVIVVATLALLASGEGAQAGVLLTENFDAGSWSPGWGQIITSPGTPGATWTRASSPLVSPTATPHSGSRVAQLNSSEAEAGASSLLYTPTLDLTSYSSAMLAFWMYHDSGNSGNNDTLTPQISINGGAWTGLGGAIGRYQDGTAHWDQATFDLSGYVGNSSVAVGFLGISALGGNIYLDDVLVTAETGTVPEPATLALVALGLAPLLIRRRLAFPRLRITK